MRNWRQLWTHLLCTSTFRSCLSTVQNRHFHTQVIDEEKTKVQLWPWQSFFHTRHIFMSRWRFSRPNTENLNTALWHIELRGKVTRYFEVTVQGLSNPYLFRIHSFRVKSFMNTFWEKWTVYRTSRTFKAQHFGSLDEYKFLSNASKSGAHNKLWPSMLEPRYKCVLIKPNY